MKEHITPSFLIALVSFLAVLIFDYPIYEKRPVRHVFLTTSFAIFGFSVGVFATCFIGRFIEVMSR